MNMNSWITKEVDSKFGHRMSITKSQAISLLTELVKVMEDAFNTEIQQYKKTVKGEADANALSCAVAEIESELEEKYKNSSTKKYKAEFRLLGSSDLIFCKIIEDTTAEQLNDKINSYIDQISKDSRRTCYLSDINPI